MTSTSDQEAKRFTGRNNIIDFIHDRELSWQRNTSPEFRYMLKEDLREVVSSKIPYCMRKELVRYPREDKCDKIFAAQWITTDTICFGTKDNQLLLWRYSTGDITNVTIPEPLSPQPTLSPVPTGDPEATDSVVFQPTGIHDIDINPSRMSLVSGGKNSQDMVLYDLPFMRPNAILKGHQDCVFSSKFIADDVLLSGGRDGLLMLWNVSSNSDAAEGTVKIIKPAQCVKHSPFRFRSVQHGKYTDRAFVLCGDCSISVFDCKTMVQVQRILLPQEADLVCLAVSEENGIISVGCQTGTILLDMRTGSIITELCDIGLPYGVRSLTFNRDLLTIGGGDSSVDFYDIRMQSRRLPHPLACSKGSVQAAQLYPDMMPQDDFPQAVYTLTYDPECSNKLFVAGGPLVCGLSGSYASVWA